jgi:hypothetical protein
VPVSVVFVRNQSACGEAVSWTPCQWPPVLQRSTTTDASIVDSLGAVAGRLARWSAALLRDVIHGRHDHSAVAAPVRVVDVPDADRRELDRRVRDKGAPSRTVERAWSVLLAVCPRAVRGHAESPARPSRARRSSGGAVLAGGPRGRVPTGGGAGSLGDRLRLRGGEGLHEAPVAGHHRNSVMTGCRSKKSTDCPSERQGRPTATLHAPDRGRRGHDRDPAVQPPQGS